MKKMSNKRNRFGVTVQGLTLAVVIIIALILSAIALYMVTKSKSTINDGNTQYSQLLNNYSEINATLYDGLYVTGDKVADVIKSERAKLNDGVLVKTIQNTTGVKYDATTAYDVSDHADDDYINPAGTFVGEVVKNDNGMVTQIIFTQR